MENTDLVNLMLAIVSATLAVVAIWLSVLFYVKSGKLNRETFGFLESLRAKTDEVCGLQKDMIKPAWERFITAPVPEAEQQKEEWTKEIKERIDGVVREAKEEYQINFQALSDEQKQRFDEMLRSVSAKSAESVAEERVKDARLKRVLTAKKVASAWFDLLRGRVISLNQLAGLIRDARPELSFDNLIDAIVEMRRLGCVTPAGGKRLEDSVLSADSMLRIDPNAAACLAAEQALLTGERDATL